MIRLGYESGRGRDEDWDEAAVHLHLRLQRLATFADLTEPFAFADGEEVERHRVVDAPVMSPHRKNRSYCCSSDGHVGPGEAKSDVRCWLVLEDAARGFSACCYVACTGDAAAGRSVHWQQKAACDAGICAAPAVDRRIARPLPAVSASACVAGDTEELRLELIRSSLRALVGTGTDQRRPTEENGDDDSKTAADDACSSENPPERETLAQSFVPRMGLGRAVADTEIAAASLHLCCRACACWVDRQCPCHQNCW
mmetsp:Transcript_27293/g.78659  ORF Transcript_27293/g.78659 Transcript_27293/m.78659 type:complete len:255 (-) Transcript_27293:133-897(-)